MRWSLQFAVIAAGVVAAASLAYGWFNSLPRDAISKAHFVGRVTCAQCHQPEHAQWLGSDHDRAMEVASDESVLADFNDTSFTYQGVTTRFFRQAGKFMVNTEGPDGELHDYEIKYTFGVRPLQQYMIEFPDGRVQVLRESWDTENKKWFFVSPPDVTDERIEPGDPLHWTGIAQNWNTTCADCHSTNVHKNYDPKRNTYKTSFDEIDVSCEECHGPGSAHVELARQWSPFWDRNLGYGLVSLKNKAVDTQLEMCAKCHARRAQIHEDFRPGRQFLDHYEPELLATNLYHADGQIQDEVYEYGSFLQSKMYANRVQCTDCHNPHSLKLKFTGNQLCAQCHVPAKYDTPTHHHHMAGSAGSQCIECHMPSRMYMVIDKRRDHSFRVPRPDLSVKFGTPNACTDCHTKGHETYEWAAEAVRKWYGDKRPSDPTWAPAFAAGRAVKPEGIDLLAELVGRKSTPEIVRATAVDLLGSYPTSSSIAVRRESLQDSDPLVRVAGVRVLGDIPGQTLINDLAARLSDPVAAVRIAAATRLAYIPLQFLTDSQHKNLEQALIEFRAAQSLVLDHSGAHLALGELDRQHGRVLPAIEHFQTAIALEPYMAGPRSELATMLQEQGGAADQIRQLREEEAKLLERDSKLAPDNAAIVYQLGLVRYLLGDFDEAETALITACRQAPQNYDYQLFLALFLKRRYELSPDESRFNAAVSALKKLSELQPANPQARQILLELIAARAALQKPPATPNPPAENQ